VTLTDDYLWFPSVKFLEVQRKAGLSSDIVTDSTEEWKNTNSCVQFLFNFNYVQEA